VRFTSGLLLSFALAMGAATSASALSINFDDLAGGSASDGELVTNQYQALGVTFSDTFAGGARAVNTLSEGLIPGSTPPNLLFVDQGSGSTTGQYLEISFAIPVQGVQTLFGTSHDANITMDAYDGGARVDSVTVVGSIVPGHNTRSGLIGLADSSITSVRLYSLNGTSSYNFGIDNLDITPTPEPATFLAIAGLALLGTATRWRKMEKGM
jgi:hypothetical protein